MTGAQYSEGTKMGDNQQRSDLDRLTEGKEGREILIVATWLRQKMFKIFDHSLFTAFYSDHPLKSINLIFF